MKCAEGLLPAFDRLPSIVFRPDDPREKYNISRRPLNILRYRTIIIAKRLKKNSCNLFPKVGAYGK